MSNVLDTPMKEENIKLWKKYNIKVNIIYEVDMLVNELLNLLLLFNN